MKTLGLQKSRYDNLMAVEKMDAQFKYASDKRDGR